MNKDHGEISTMMDLETYENLLKLARKYRVDSFSFGEVTVNLSSDFSEGPDSSTPASEMHEDIEDMPSKEGDYLITNPMMGQ